MNVISCAAMSDSSGAKPPAKEAAREEAQRKRRLVDQLIRLETQDLFENALRQFGIEQNSAEWNQAVTAWREKQKKLR